MSSVRYVGVPTHWGSTGNGGTGGDWGVYLPPPEHFCAVHFYPSYHDFCLVAEKNPVMRLSRRWWDHTSLDIMGIRAGNAATEGGRGSEESEAEG